MINSLTPFNEEKAKDVSQSLSDSPLFDENMSISDKNRIADKISSKHCTIPKKDTEVTSMEKDPIEQDKINSSEISIEDDNIQEKDEPEFENVFHTDEEHTKELHLLLKAENQQRQNPEFDHQIGIMSPSAILDFQSPRDDQIRTPPSTKFLSEVDF